MRLKQDYGAGAQAILDGCSQSQEFFDGEAEAKPEIWGLVPQP